MVREDMENIQDFIEPLENYNKKNADNNSRLQICHPNDNISRSISSGRTSALKCISTIHKAFLFRLMDIEADRQMLSFLAPVCLSLLLKKKGFLLFKWYKLNEVDVIFFLCQNKILILIFFQLSKDNVIIKPIFNKSLTYLKHRQIITVFNYFLIMLLFSIVT